jgi:antitoxin MazE
MAAQIQISKWGNSLGLRVPRDVAAKAGLSEGTRVELQARADGSILIKKAKRRYTLEELLAGMTPERQHPLLLDDAPRGHEML